MHTHRFTMTVSRLALVMSIALAGNAALAVGQDATEHTAHHPAGASSALNSAPMESGAVTGTKSMNANCSAMGDAMGMAPGMSGMGMMGDMAGHHQMMQMMMDRLPVAAEK